ncbi:MAG: hypothetical protein JWL77_630 [Chthonomonadaceae bacterium]|nr:hypothetical protein [Chthonomonadaceae bacterium]
MIEGYNYLDLLFQNINSIYRPPKPGIAGKNGFTKTGEIFIEF